MKASDTSMCLTRRVIRKGIATRCGKIGNVEGKRVRIGRHGWHIVREIPDTNAILLRRDKQQGRRVS